LLELEFDTQSANASVLGIVRNGTVPPAPATFGKEGEVVVAGTVVADDGEETGEGEPRMTEGVTWGGGLREMRRGMLAERAREGEEDEEGLLAGEEEGREGGGARPVGEARAAETDARLEALNAISSVSLC
jgi:hypothetical protein